MVLVAGGAITAFVLLLAFTRPDPMQTVVRALLLLAFMTLPWGAVQVAGVPLGDLPLIVALLIMGVLYLPRAKLYFPAGTLIGAALIAISGLITEAMPPSQTYLDGRFTIDLEYLLNAGLGLRSVSNLGTLFKYEISLIVLPLVAILAIQLNARMARSLATAWVVGVLVSDLVAYTDSKGLTAISDALLGYTSVVPRFAGLTPQPNFVGVQTAMALPLILLAYRRSTLRTRVIATCALGIAAEALVSAGSRGSAVAAMIAVPLTLLAVPELRAWVGRTVYVLLGGVAIVLMTPVGANLLTSVRLGGGAAGVAESDSDRLTSRDQGFADVTQSPIHGIGWGHSVDAHMIYLQVAAAGGLIALVGFIWYIGNIIARSWRDLRPASVLAGGLIASALTWMVLGLVENQLTDQWAYVPMALLIGLIAQAHTAQVARAHEAAQARLASADDSDPTAGVDPVEKKPNTPFRKKLIHRLPRPLPVSVVVDDDYRAWAEAIEQGVEFMPGGLVPVGVQTQQRDPVGRLTRQGLLYIADDVVDALGWIARLGHEPLYAGQGRPRPDLGVLGVVNGHQGRRALPEGIDIVSAGWRHTLERVAQIQVAVGDTELFESERSGIHAAPAPYPTFDDRAWNRRLSDLPHRLPERVEPWSGGHRVGLGGSHDTLRVLFVVVVVDHGIPEASKRRLQRLSYRLLNHSHDALALRPNDLSALSKFAHLDEGIGIPPGARPLSETCWQIEVPPPFPDALYSLSKRGRCLIESQNLR